MRRLKTPSKHKPVPGLEEMQEGRHPREGELAYEDGGIETGVFLLFVDLLSAVCVCLREGTEDDGEEGDVGWVVLEVGVSWEVFAA